MINIRKLTLFQYFNIVKHLLTAILLLLSSFDISAQKVGLVFSGGGAKGLAHIGVLKALEEHHIPIDYITGTSMGAIVGSLYAAGYSPQEIEYIALSEDFQNWVGGKYKSDYSYYFDKKPLNPSFFSAKVQIDTGFTPKLRSSLINDIPLNFALLELLAQASATAQDNFDNLFIPFRCIVADVFSQEMIILKQGNLTEAVRGSMSVPLVYRPIKVDNKFVVDGGLYNNFPVDVMKSEFNPDVIIGTNVSSKNFTSYPSEHDEALMSKLFMFMLLSKSDSTTIGENGIFLEPNLKNVNSTNFKPVKEIIEEGYRTAIAEMPAILKKIKRRIQEDELIEKRREFNNRNPYLKFNSVNVNGVNSKKKSYVKNIFNYENKELSLSEIKNGYYKLLGDDNFETTYPSLKFKPEDNKYEFNVLVQPQGNFKADFGGNISIRPISNAYIGLQYSFLDKVVYTFNANFYTGRFYESALGAARIDFPFKTPFFIEGQFVYNNWDFFNSGELFSKNKNPDYVKQSDRRSGLRAGIYAGKSALFQLYGFHIYNRDNYSPNQTFTSGSILDFSSLDGFISGINYSKNTLNRKQYASSGMKWDVSLNFISGFEKYHPGNIITAPPQGTDMSTQKSKREWLKLDIQKEKYYSLSGRYALGYAFHGVLSNRPKFTTYMSNLLNSSSFYPLQDSRSIFNTELRADNFMAIGIKNVYNIRKNTDLRIEGFVFQPFNEIKQQNIQQAKFGNLFADRSFIANTALIYHTPIGPISANVNYYDNNTRKFGFLFHIGYLLYNKRALEL